MSLHCLTYTLKVYGGWLSEEGILVHTGAVLYHSLELKGWHAKATYENQNAMASYYAAIIRQARPACNDLRRETCFAQSPWDGMDGVITLPPLRLYADVTWIMAKPGRCESLRTRPFS